MWTDVTPVFSGSFEPHQSVLSDNKEALTFFFLYGRCQLCVRQAETCKKKKNLAFPGLPVGLTGGFQSRLSGDEKCLFYGSCDVCGCWMGIVVGDKHERARLTFMHPLWVCMRVFTVCVCVCVLQTSRWASHLNASCNYQSKRRADLSAERRLEVALPTTSRLQFLAEKKTTTGDKRKERHRLCDVMWWRQRL